MLEKNLNFEILKFMCEINNNYYNRLCIINAYFILIVPCKFKKEYNKKTRIINAIIKIYTHSIHMIVISVDVFILIYPSSCEKGPISK